VKGLVKSVFVGSAALIALAATPAWAELKIGYVNFPQLADESPQAKAINDALRNEFLSRQRDLQNEDQALKARDAKLQKDAATMSDDQRAREEKALRDGARDLSRKQSEFQDDVNARRNEEISRLQRTLIEEVRAYGHAQNYDLIVTDAVYTQGGVDITQAVLAQLKAHAPAAAAPAPAPAPAAPTKSPK